jgi:hypothetical protein
MMRTIAGLNHGEGRLDGHCNQNTSMTTGGSLRVESSVLTILPYMYVNRSAQQRCRWVFVALCAPAHGYAGR